MYNSMLCVFQIIWYQNWPSVYALKYVLKRPGINWEQCHWFSSKMSTWEQKNGNQQSESSPVTVSSKAVCPFHFCLMIEPAKNTLVVVTKRKSLTGVRILRNARRGDGQEHLGRLLLCLRLTFQAIPHKRDLSKGKRKFYFFTSVFRHPYWLCQFCPLLLSGTTDKSSFTALLKKGT